MTWQFSISSRLQKCQLLDGMDLKMISKWEYWWLRILQSATMTTHWLHSQVKANEFSRQCNQAKSRFSVQIRSKWQHLSRAGLGEVESGQLRVRWPSTLPLFPLSLHFLLYFMLSRQLPPHKRSLDRSTLTFPPPCLTTVLPHRGIRNPNPMLHLIARHCYTLTPTKHDGIGNTSNTSLRGHWPPLLQAWQYPTS